MSGLRSGMGSNLGVFRFGLADYLFLRERVDDVLKRLAINFSDQPSRAWGAGRCRQEAGAISGKAGAPARHLIHVIGRTGPRL